MINSLEVQLKSRLNRHLVRLELMELQRILNLQLPAYHAMKENTVTHQDSL